MSTVVWRAAFKRSQLWAQQLSPLKGPGLVGADRRSRPNLRQERAGGWTFL